MLADGTYDALVVDASETEPGALALELTILAGPHKGEMVTVHATGLDRDPLDLLAVPATLTIAADEPTVVLEG
ncbi:MAG: hypothetical protein JWM05_3257 [Acidimicrobiales bacterium]|nr:hypothetical protein [Acidimicrobiales bacterium]